VSIDEWRNGPDLKIGDWPLSIESLVCTPDGTYTRGSAQVPVAHPASPQGSAAADSALVLLRLRHVTRPRGFPGTRSCRVTRRACAEVPK